MLCYVILIILYYIYIYIYIYHYVELYFGDVLHCIHYCYF